MVLVLVIGDFSIPQNKIEIPAKFKKLLVPGKINHALVTGQISHPLKMYLDTICPSTFTTSSTSHHSSIIKSTPLLSKFQKYIVTEFEGWRIGLIQSSSLLLHNDDLSGKEAVARSLDVDVLVSDSKMAFTATERNGRFFLDPGSVTGAWSVHNASQERIPSFVLMDVSPKQLTLYIYKLVQDDQVKVEKMEFVKPVKDVDDAEE